VKKAAVRWGVSDGSEASCKSLVKFKVKVKVNVKIKVKV